MDYVCTQCGEAFAPQDKEEIVKNVLVSQTSYVLERIINNVRKNYGKLIHPVL